MRQASVNRIESVLHHLHEIHYQLPQERDTFTFTGDDRCCVQSVACIVSSHGWVADRQRPQRIKKKKNFSRKLKNIYLKKNEVQEVKIFSARWRKSRTWATEKKKTLIKKLK